MGKGCHRIRHKSMQRGLSFPAVTATAVQPAAHTIEAIGLPKTTASGFRDECKQITFPHRVHFAYIGQAGIYIGFSSALANNQ